MMFWVNFIPLLFFFGLLWIFIDNWLFQHFKIFFVKIFVITNLLSTILLGKLQHEMFDRNDRFGSSKVQ